MYHFITLGEIVMKFKSLALLALVGMCVGSQAMAGNSSRILLADDASSQSAGASGSSDSSTGSSDSSGSGATDNAGSVGDTSMPSNGDDTSGDTGTGDDDY
jgi:hypothetical protein